MSLRTTARATLAGLALFASSGCREFSEFMAPIAGDPIYPPGPTNFGKIVPSDNYTILGDTLSQAVFLLDRRRATNIAELQYGYVQNGTFVPAPPETPNTLRIPIPQQSQIGSAAFTIRRIDPVRNEQRDTTVTVPVYYQPIIGLGQTPHPDSVYAVRLEPFFINQGIIPFSLVRQDVPISLRVEGPGIHQLIHDLEFNQSPRFYAPLSGEYRAETCIPRANRNDSFCRQQFLVKP